MVFECSSYLASSEIALARTRILVTNQPRLMRESVTCTAGDQDEVEIVGQTEDIAEIPDLVEVARPDGVIFSPEKPGKRPHNCDALPGLCPNIKIPEVTFESKCGFLYGSASN